MRAVSISRRARSTAASKRCRRTPKASAASSSRGSRSCSSDSISGSISPGSSSATAAATTAATGVRLNGSDDRGAVDQHHRGDPLDQLLVAHHVRAADVQARRCGSAGSVAARGQELEHVAPVDRLGAVHAPGGQREHGQALDQPHEEAERARAGGDDDRGAQRDRLRRRGQQRLLDGQPRGEMARRARRRTAAARRGRRSAARPRRAAALGEVLGLTALEVHEAARRALHRVDQVVGDVDPVQRRVQPRAGRRVAEHEVVSCAAGGLAASASGRSRGRRDRRARGAGRARRRRSRTRRSRGSASRMLPRLTGSKTSQIADFAPRKGGGKGAEAGYFRERHEEPAFCGSGAADGPCTARTAPL